jgi:hypothetical protein
VAPGESSGGLLDVSEKGGRGDQGGSQALIEIPRREEITMAKDHGSSVKNDKQYEGLRKKGMSKQRAASIANSSESSKKGGERSGKGKGGSKSQKRAAGREGGKESGKSS